MHSCFSCKNSTDFTPPRKSPQSNLAFAGFTCVGPPLLGANSLEPGAYTMLYQCDTGAVTAEGWEIIPNTGCDNYVLCDHLHGVDLSDIGFIHFRKTSNTNPDQDLTHDYKLTAEQRAIACDLIAEHLKACATKESLEKAYYKAKVEYLEGLGDADLLAALFEYLEGLGDSDLSTALEDVFPPTRLIEKQ